jgi:agmatinase
MDLVEVSPPHDQSGITSILAAQILMNMVGRIFYK